MMLSGRVLREDGSGEAAQVHALNDVAITRKGASAGHTVPDLGERPGAEQLWGGWHCHRHTDGFHWL